MLSIMIKQCFLERQVYDVVLQLILIKYPGIEFHTTLIDQLPLENEEAYVGSLIYD